MIMLITMIKWINEAIVSSESIELTLYLTWDFHAPNVKQHVIHLSYYRSLVVTCTFLCICTACWVSCFKNSELSWQRMSILPNYKKSTKHIHNWSKKVPTSKLIVPGISKYSIERCLLIKVFSLPSSGKQWTPISHFVRQIGNLRCKPWLLLRDGN